VAEFFAGAAATPGWGFLRPMVELVEWVAAQPIAARLYPGTSHAWLMVGLHPGYEPGRPFFSAGYGWPVNQRRFEYKLWSSVGRLLDTRVVPVAQVREVFAEFVQRLDSIR
jgi:hypothetical protein